MSSAIQENAEHAEQQLSLVQAALNAQLGVLALFLPTVVIWRIGQHPAKGSPPLISIEPAPDTLADYLDTLGQDIARAISGSDVYHRPVTAEEVRRWPDLQKYEITALYILPLNAGDEADHFLLGLAKSDLPDGPPALFRQVRLCIHALNASLAMYVRLASSEMMMRAMRRDVFVDPLTNVMNRAGWEHSLSSLQATPDHEDIAILVLDLDMLKQVNDTQGHGAGDLLLKRTAQTLNSVLRSTDTVARLGGDEFAIALRHATPAAADLITQRLSEELSAIEIHVSIGVAFRSEANGSLAAAIAMADARMYANKRTRAIAEQLSIFARTLGS